MQVDLSSYLIKNPESFFDIPTLTHKSSEIEDAILRFGQPAEDKEVYKVVINLLRATASFRYATVPDGIFAEARNLQHLDEPLNKVLQDMEQHFASAESALQQFNDEDKTILKKAIAYCQKSVRERMLAIPFNDSLFLLWLKSPLRQRIEK